MFSPMRLWGPEHNLPYWTALGLGLVSPSERRAMDLLRSVSDERRFSIYASTGLYPARGNVSGATYLIPQFGRVIELAQGTRLSEWCIESRAYGLPKTDRVVLLRNLIEGEEFLFRKIANKSLVGGGGEPPEAPWWEKPLWSSPVEVETARPLNHDFVDFERLWELLHLADPQLDEPQIARRDGWEVRGGIGDYITAPAWVESDNATTMNVDFRAGLEARILREIDRSMVGVRAVM